MTRARRHWWVMIAMGAAAVVVVGTCLYLMFAYSARRAAEAMGRGIALAVTSTTVHSEPLRGMPPISLDRDTVGRLTSLAHIDYRTVGPDSFLVYVGAWSGGGAHAKPPEPLAAIDSPGGATVPHELRLVPFTTVAMRQKLGILLLQPDSMLIPVYRGGNAVTR